MRKLKVKDCIKTADEKISERYYDVEHLKKKKELVYK